MTKDTQPTYLVTITPEPWASDPSGIRRVRLALKRMLRSLGLRVTDIRETTDASEGKP